MNRDESTVREIWKAASQKLRAAVETAGAGRTRRQSVPGVMAIPALAGMAVMVAFLAVAATNPILAGVSALAVTAAVAGIAVVAWMWQHRKQQKERKHITG